MTHADFTEYHQLRDSPPSDMGPILSPCETPIRAPRGLHLSYRGNAEELIKGVDNGDLEPLAPAIVSASSDRGLDFLASTARGRINEERFVEFIRRVTDAPADEPILLYRRFLRTERRVYDRWSYDFKYHFSYVVLMPDDTYVEVHAPSEYSPTYDRD